MPFPTDLPPPPRRRQVRSLLLPLSLSCLLHAVVFSLPHPGVHSAAGPGASPGPQTAPRVFAVSLAPKHLARPAVPAPASGGGDLPAEAVSRGSDSSATQETKARSEGAGLLPLPGPAYFTTDQLTRRPQAVSVAELDTTATRPYIVRGALILLLKINELGQVMEAEVEQSDLPEIFAETAASVFRNARFTPGERDGRKVNTLMRIEVRWDDPRLAKP